MAARRFALNMRGLCTALVATLTIWFASSEAARAQSIPPPPVRTAVDANGVDVISGTLRTSMPGISVGPAGAGGLAYSPTFDSTAQAWRDGLSGTINSSGTTYTVSLFGRSQIFTLSGGVFTPTEPNGEALTLSGNIYTYTTRNGRVATFSKLLAGNSPTQANEGRVETITSPSGERLTFTYTTLNSTTQRLQSLNNNLGYQLKFEYQNDDPATGGLTLIKVTAINNAVEYCSPTTNGCAGLSATWPSLAFNAALPTTVTDALGRVTRYTYTNGRITAIRLPASAADDLTIAYDANNRVASIANGIGTWTYAYVDTGSTRVTTVTDPLSHQTVFGVNTSLLVVQSATDGLGRTTSYQYDSSQRLKRITQPEGNYTEYTYDSIGRITTTTRAPKPGSALQPVGTSAVYGCPSPATCDLPSSVTDERGYRTDFTYDLNHGGILTVTSPAPSGGTPVGTGTRPQTRYTYQSMSAYYLNSSGAIVQAPTPVVRLVETSACATLASCAGGADETRTVLSYGASGVANNLVPVSITERSGDNTLSATSAMTYDNVRNVLTVDGPLAGTADTTRTRYDVMRQVIGVIGPDPDGGGALKHRAQRFTYNANGQPTAIDNGTVNSQSDPDWAAFSVLETASITYDNVERRASSALVVSGVTQTVQQFEYDAANRMLCSTTRMNPAVFGSLPAACTLSTQGANGPDRILRTSYNSANQITQVTSGYGTPSPINESTTTYTNNGLPATVADGAGNLTTFEYDGLDRLSRQRYPNAANGSSSSTTDTEQIAYNSGSMPVVRVLRDGQNILYTYDNLGRPTLTDAPGTAQDISASYDLFSRQLTATANGQAVSFVYDQLSRQLSETAFGVMTSSQYDLADRRTRITHGDGTFFTYDYDLADAVTAIRENGAASGIGVLGTYVYDNLGRRTSLTRGNGVVTSYAYDPASRLATLTQNLAGTAQDQTATLSYNPGDQITQRVTTNAAYDTPAPFNGTTTYQRNGLNQYNASGGFTYDARGNLTATLSATYSYDIYNRLTGAGTSTFNYDALGRLRESVGAGVTTRLQYDGGDLIGEYNTSGTLLRRYVHGPGMDEPLVWYEGSGTTDRRWLVADERGSVIAVTNAFGAASTINTYDEYGQPGAANAGRFQYTGQQWLPEASLYHYKARAYSAVLGRFLQTDPIGFEGGMNLYAYVANDPVNLVDPSGLEEVSCGYLCTEETDPIVVTASRPRPGPGWSTAGAFFQGWQSENDPHRMLERLTPPARINEDPRANDCEYASLSTCLAMNAANATSDEYETTLCGYPGCTVDIITLGLGGPESRALRAAARCGCFVEGTQVATPEGLRPIEGIAVGDQVLAWNPETGETTTQTVTALIRPEPKATYELVLLDAGGERERFGTTADHPWFVVGRGWVETTHLEPQDRIVSARGADLMVQSLILTGRTEQTFNLEIDGPHTFLVGEDGAVVHNFKCSLERMRHIFDRHVRPALNASRFNAGQRMAALIRAARATTPVPQGSRLAYITNAGRNIGVDRSTGAQTSIYTVITDSRGNVVTMFPGRP